MESYDLNAVRARQRSLCTLWLARKVCSNKSCASCQLSSDEYYKQLQSLTIEKIRELAAERRACLESWSGRLSPVIKRPDESTPV